MASLLGIDVNQTVSMTCVIGGALAVVAGLMFMVYYGVVSFTDGFTPGIKAFTAAVLGGIGNIPGAMLGGLVLGQLENFFGTYLPILTAGNFGTAYKDVVAFAVIIALIGLFPTGLIAEKSSEC